MTVPEKKSVKDLEDWRQAIRHSILNFSTKKCGLQFYPNLSRKQPAAAANLWSKTSAFGVV